MRFSLLMITGLALHIVLGNLCLTPIVHATMMPENTHDTMLMTPMPNIDCVYCSQESVSDPAPVKKAACHSGNCFTRASEQMPSSMIGTALQYDAVIPTFIQLRTLSKRMHTRITKTHAPPTMHQKESVVLLC